MSHSPEELINVSCLVVSCQSATVVHSLRGRGGSRVRQEEGEGGNTYVNQYIEPQ